MEYKHDEWGVDVTVSGSQKGLMLPPGLSFNAISEKAKIIRKWAAQGKIVEVDPHHLFFSIWATTQHYADFDIQVRSVLNDETIDPFDTAAPFLKKMFSTMLMP